MANRILFNSGKLLVSKAGIDVTAATVQEDDLLFSSDFQGARVWKRGSVSVTGPSTLTVDYGRTFTGVPMGVFYVLEGTNYVHPALYTAVVASAPLYRAQFSTSSVIFVNASQVTRTYYYAIIEVDT